MAGGSHGLRGHAGTEALLRPRGVSRFSLRQPGRRGASYYIAGKPCSACKLLKRPPILSYDGYALYNWKRFRKGAPIALGNIDTIQNFVHLYDEHWFILVHIEIEALAARILDAIASVQVAQSTGDAALINDALWTIAACIDDQINVLRRIPEKMDPALYYKTFRPYIRFFDNVVYETEEQSTIASRTSDPSATVRMNFRGETGAQSSIMPTLVAFMKVPHKPSMLTNHLADMRNYMPPEHRQLIEAVEAMPSFRGLADKQPYNAVLEAMAGFRAVHYGWAQEYINRRTDDPRGTAARPTCNGSTSSSRRPVLSRSFSRLPLENRSGLIPRRSLPL